MNDPHAASITRTRHRVCILSLLLLLGLQGVEAPLAESARLHKRSPVNPPASTCVLPKAQGQTQKISFSHSPHAKKFLPLCQLAGETYPAVFQYLDHLNTLYTLAKNESTLTPGNPALMFSEEALALELAFAKAHLRHLEELSPLLRKALTSKAHEEHKWFLAIEEEDQRFHEHTQTLESMARELIRSLSLDPATLQALPQPQYALLHTQHDHLLRLAGMGP